MLRRLLYPQATSLGCLPSEGPSLPTSSPLYSPLDSCFQEVTVGMSCPLQHGCSRRPRAVEESEQWVWAPTRGPCGGAGWGEGQYLRRQGSGSPSWRGSRAASPAAAGCCLAGSQGSAATAAAQLPERVRRPAGSYLGLS